MAAHVWIIDDEQAICWALRRAFEKEGHLVEVFSNARDALSQLTSSSKLNAVMMDMRMPGMDGFQATEQIKKLRPDVPIIMMTAFGDLSTAVQAIDAEVFEYLTKPFDLQAAIKVVSKAIAAQKIQLDNHKGSVDQIELVGDSPAIQTVYKQVAMAARSDAPVLIQGPVGAGKEMIAAAIHRHSLRKDAPFLVITPAAIAPIALSLELFGGALGGKYRSGALELAANGHLFLDEVVDLTLPVQTQLLRVLESKRYAPLSGTAKDCTTRIIASTSRDLNSVVQEGDFLAALAERLSVIVIEVAALCDRKADIVAIARSILRSIDPEGQVSFSDAAEQWMLEQAWPGNIRQLEAVVQRARMTCRGEQIQLDDLMSSYQRSQPKPQAAIGKDDALAQSVREWTRSHLKKLEREGTRVHSSNDDMFGTMHEDFLSAVEAPFLQTMMEACGNNRANVAAQLGLHRSTLRQKMRKYNLD